MSSNLISSLPPATHSTTSDIMDTADVIKRGIPDEKVLEPLFKRMLQIFNSQGLFYQSPTFFVVYAHDNDTSAAKANADVVKDYMKWFRMAGCNIESDTTPPSARNIVEDQCCLLPFGVYPERSVELVLLCGSDLLGEYMQNEHFSDFVDEMNKEYKKARQEGKSKGKVYGAVHQVQRKFHEMMGKDFHHVQTEVALLRTRVEFKERETILLLLLNGNFRHNFPSFVNDGNAYLRTELGANSKYECFLEVIEKFISRPESVQRPASLVRKMKEIYHEAFLQLHERVSEARQIVQEHIDQVNKATNDWTNNQRSSVNRVTVADIKVALNKYVDRLEIRTVLGQKLDLCKHHIKLKVVEPSGEANALTLTDLFEQRKLKNGQTGRPNRIMIQGPPGIGKSTLSKQIIREMRQRDAFTWVLWVPLCSFKRHTDLPTLIKNEYFPNEPRKDDLSSLLYQRIFEQDRAHTLLILDGWDEVTCWTEEKTNHISEFIKFNNVIVTSRFGVWDTTPEVSFDLVLKATGFDDQAIRHYLLDREGQQFPTTAAEVVSLMAKDQSIKGLGRVPMHLDILWSIWDRLKPNIAPGIFPNITMLYQAMVTRLWCRDYASFNNNEYDELQACRLSDRALLGKVRQERHCLGKMAIELINKGQETLDSNAINRIVNEVDPDGEQGNLLENIQKVSFLRSDDLDQQPIHAFIHLTFQEFFAAEWLTEDMSSLRPFVQRYKYDRHFETVLRLVSGLLVAKKKYDELSTFFKYIEEDPRLEFVHEQLAMRCLSETELGQNQELDKMRKRLEGCLSKYVVSEAHRTSSPKLSSHPELPQRILTDILKDPGETQDVKLYVLKTMAKGESFIFSRETSAVISALLGGNPPKRLNLKILGVFYTCRSRELPEDIVEQTARLLNNSDRALSWFALQVLSIQKVLPPTTSERIATGLNDDDQQVRRTAITALGRVRGSLSNEIVDSILKLLLHDPDDSVRGTVVIALRDRRDLPNYAVQLIERVMEDRENTKTSDWVYWYHSKSMVTRQPLPENVIEAPIERRSNPRSSTDVRRAAAEDLFEQVDLMLPLSVMQNIVETLVNYD